MIQNEVQKICLPSMIEEWAPDSKFKCFISGFGLSSVHNVLIFQPGGFPQGFQPELLQRHINEHGTLKWSQTDVDLLNKECQDWLEQGGAVLWPCLASNCQLPNNYTKPISNDLICSRLSKDAVTSVRQVFNYGIKYVLNIKIFKILIENMNIKF